MLFQGTSKEGPAGEAYCHRETDEQGSDSSGRPLPLRLRGFPQDAKAEREGGPPPLVHAVTHRTQRTAETSRSCLSKGNVLSGYAYRGATS